MHDIEIKTSSILPDKHEWNTKSHEEIWSQISSPSEWTKLLTDSCYYIRDSSKQRRTSVASVHARSIGSACILKRIPTSARTPGSKTSWLPLATHHLGKAKVYSTHRIHGRACGFYKRNQQEPRLCSLEHHVQRHFAKDSWCRSTDSKQGNGPAMSLSATDLHPNG